MQRILAMLLLFLSPIYAHMNVQVFNGNPVDIVWDSYGGQYEYRLEIYKEKDGVEKFNFYIRLDIGK